MTRPAFFGVDSSSPLSNKRMQLTTLVFKGRSLSCETGEFWHKLGIERLVSGRVAADAQSR